jgi:hypothetical protein
MSDSRLRDRDRDSSKLVGDVSHLFASRAAPPRPAEPDGPDEFSPDGDYQAHARPANKEQPAIHFLARDGSARTFQFIHLDSDSRYEPSTASGARLVFRFMGAVPVEVVITGRNLWPLYNYIALHRMPWAWELPARRDFEGNDKAVVTSIVFRPPSLEGAEE